MKVFKFASVPDWSLQKCPSCGWMVYNLYTMAHTQVDANRHFESEDIALCGDCLCKFMSEGGHTVVGSQVD